MSRRFRILLALLVGAAVAYGLDLFRVFGPRVVIRPPPNCVNFQLSDDGTTLMTLNALNADLQELISTIRWWDTHTGRLLRTFVADDSGPVLAAYSNDAARFAGLCRNGAIKLWHWHDGEWHADYDWPEVKKEWLVTLLLFNDSDELLLFERNYIRDAKTHRVIADLSKVTMKIGYKTMSYKGDHVLLGDLDDCVLVPLRTGNVIARFPGLPEIDNFDVSANGQWLTNPLGGRVEVYRAGIAVPIEFSGFETIYQPLLSPDGEWLFVLESVRRSRFMEWLTGDRERARLRLFHRETQVEHRGIDDAQQMIFSRDGKTVAAAMAGGAIHIWDFPLRTPWLRIGIWAVLAAVGVYKLFGLSHRRRKS